VISELKAVIARDHHEPCCPARPRDAKPLENATSGRPMKETGVVAVNELSSRFRDPRRQICGQASYWRSISRDRFAIVGRPIWRKAVSGVRSFSRMVAIQIFLGSAQRKLRTAKNPRREKAFSLHRSSAAHAMSAICPSRFPDRKSKRFPRHPP